MKMLKCVPLLAAFAVAAFPSSARAAKLLAYYDFNDVTDPSVAPDLSGNAPNASLRGPAVFTADAGGYSSSAGDRALDLGAAGNNAYAVTAAGGHLQLANLTGAMSVSWWQNNAGNGAGGWASSSSFWITAPAANGGQRGFQAHAPWGNNTVFFDQSGCCTATQRLTVPAAGTVTAGVWQHFVMQRDNAGNMEIWVDGALVASSTGVEALDIFDGFINIGSQINGFVSFPGQIDEFAVYAGFLTSAEITSLVDSTMTPADISAELPDADDDGLADAWEAFYGLSTTDDGSVDVNNGPLGDQDMDGLNNLGEVLAGLSPIDGDWDDDTLLDGAETNTGIWVDVTNTGSNPFVTDTDGDTLLDNLENPDLPFVDANQPGSDPNLVDTDADGIPDPTEVAAMFNPNSLDTDGNGTPDSAEDPDMDTLTNLQEVALGTNLVDADTDGDDFDDNVESNTGVWVSVSDTGTDPLDSDTDGDTILDGVENHDLAYDPANPTTQPGTDPNIVDTDGDIASDQLELAQGTDPTDPNDKPAITIVTTIPAFLGGDLTDPEGDGQLGPVDAGPPQTAGTNFDWVSIGASNEAYFGGFGPGADTQGAFDVFDNLRGAGDKWCCAGPPLDLTVEFAQAISLTHFTVTSSLDVPDRDPRDWEIQGSNDGISFDPIFQQSGDPQLWTARNQTLRFDLGAPSAPYKFIRYAVTRTNNANHQITEIEYFGAPVDETIEITAITYDEGADEITLTWTSDPTRTYTILNGTDLKSFPEEIDDSMPGAMGETTSLTFANRLVGAERQFFIVIQNPLQAD